MNERKTKREWKIVAFYTEGKWWIIQFMCKIYLHRSIATSYIYFILFNFGDIFLWVLKQQQVNTQWIEVGGGGGGGGWLTTLLWL